MLQNFPGHFNLNSFSGSMKRKWALHSSLAEVKPRLIYLSKFCLFYKQLFLRGLTATVPHVYLNIHIVMTVNGAVLVIFAIVCGKLLTFIVLLLIA